MFHSHSSYTPKRPSQHKASHPTTAPPPMPSFTAIIDADHDAINAAAVRLARLLRSPAPTSTTPEDLHAIRRRQLALLHDVTWRLVRHDLSEELVMRPAFIRHMGPIAGREAAEHDRQDHENARRTLLELYAAFEACAVGDAQTAGVLTERYLALLAELAEHMKRESGEEMPALEAGLGREESVELGRRYMETLVVTPELVLRGRRVFRDVGDFVHASKQSLLQVWAEVQREEQRRRGGRL
ncbi:uncharacterized protein HMPREF1541_05805 [Cyphellophora europaea CBS 101466]|uniref:Hemerythrin-like domain-containing protein n=1 Tax=Cyphellophora europaea (strain CBS 101466) TaxID=1220924 RepID=W2RV45_CYPE1|nr:uncharacterized protein HMPREF1541_05805 [Cyphellophora europaea CBS 101466]ETN39579.1 hypothetical protein HMPREF1541_05805 [Cyphellophora europaea CBS 101466]